MCGTDMAYHGTEMVNDSADANTAIECRSACQDDPKCEFWDFGDNTCRLRPNDIDTTKLRHSDGYAYGIKNCLFFSNWNISYLNIVNFQFYYQTLTKTPTHIESSPKSC